MSALTKRLSAVTVDEPMTAKLTAHLLGEMLRTERPITDAAQFSVAARLPLGRNDRSTAGLGPALASTNLRRSHCGG